MLLQPIRQRPINTDTRTRRGQVGLALFHQHRSRRFGQIGMQLTCRALRPGHVLHLALAQGVDAANHVRAKYLARLYVPTVDACDNPTLIEILAA